MSALTLAAIVQLSVLGAGETYAEAHRENAETGRPLVILVGADWCPGCRTMKQSIMPQVEQTGTLDKVAFAVVNSDHERSLARQLTGGGSIPQLIMYHQTATGWKRKTLVGAQSVRTIQSFLEQGAAAATAVRATVQPVVTR